MAEATGSSDGAAAPEGIDRAGVEGWFEANVAEVELPLSFERIAGGHSNLTYRVEDSAGRRWALRRPPLGKRLGSAHDMAREHKVISALGPTPVPVAPVVGLCEDDSVNGAPFYAMEFVEGPVLRGLAERSGRDLSELDFFVALGYWKLAIILEGVYARYAAGQYGKTDPGIEHFARLVEGLAEAAEAAEGRG